MRKTKLLVVSIVVGVISILPGAPAQAATCDDFLGPDVSNEEEVCRIAGEVICWALAKGEPCLM